jgi:UDP-glucose 4-epimerase
MILVTGAAGFVGNSVVEGLDQKTITTDRVTPKNKDGHLHLNANLASEAGVDELTNWAKREGLTISQVIHVAGVTPWSTDPDFSDDIKMAKTIAKLCNAFDVESLFYFSGWVVYDPEQPNPWTEETPTKPTSEYGKSKLAVEMYLANNLKKTKLVNLRLTSLYGPGQKSPGLITNLVRDALADNSMNLEAKQTKRDYLFIDDFVQTIKALVQQKYAHNTTFNIGTGESTSVYEVARVIASVCKELTGNDVSIRLAPILHESEPRDNKMAIQRAQGLGLLKDKTPLFEGIKQYVKWAIDEAVL